METLRCAEGQQRSAQLVPASEGQLHLRLDPGDLSDSKPTGLPGAVAQKRRLANARLTPDEEDRALATSGAPCRG